MIPRIGGAGDDSIRSGQGDDLIFGEAGNDTLLGGAGADTVSGGAGDDELGGGAGDDVLAGNAGNDTITGGPGDDTMFGGAGDAAYQAVAMTCLRRCGSDTCRAVVGDNCSLLSKALTSTVMGGAGDDTASFTAASADGMWSPRRQCNDRHLRRWHLGST